METTATGPSGPSASRSLQHHDTEVPTPPKLVWQTLVRSPHVQWILSGRYLEPDRVMAAFVGHTYVELKEWDAAADTLRTIAMTPEFPARIRAAQILGERRRKLSEFTAAEAATEGRRQRGISRVPTATIREPERQVIDDDSPMISHQILVLALEDSSLVFISAAMVSGEVQYLVRSSPLMADSALKQVGKLIAADPACRAIAVSALDDVLMVARIAKTSHADFPRSELVRESVIISTEMTIRSMDFLHAPESDQNIVMLVVCGIKNRVAYVNTYIWDEGQPLTPGSIRKRSERLGKEHGFPSFLVRLYKPAFFLLVCDRNIASYLVSVDGSREQTGTVSIRNLDAFENSYPPSFEAEALSTPAWTNWAKPPRRPKWDKEVVYLVREDGLLAYILCERNSYINGKHRIFMAHPGGRLDGMIGSAFAMLDIPQVRLGHGVSINDYKIGNFGPGYPDTFVFVGNQCDGALVEIGMKITTVEPDMEDTPRAEAHAPQLRDRFANWTPIFATALVPRHPPKEFVNAGSDLNLDRVLLACGRAPYGSVAEVRAGLEAVERDVSLQAGDFDPQGVSDLWFFQMTGAAFLVLSYPWKTIWCLLPTYEGHGTPTGLVEHLTSFDMSGHTLAAAKLDYCATADTDIEEYAVLVFETTIALFSLERESRNLVEVRRETVGRLSSASIDREKHMMVTCAVSEHTHLLVAHRLHLQGRDLLESGKPFLSDLPITCVTVFSQQTPDHSSAMGIPTLLIAGTSGGSIRVSRIDATLALHPLLDLQETGVDGDELGRSVESVYALSSAENGGAVAAMSVFSSSRNGQMTVHHMFYNHSRLSLSRQQNVTLGNSPARLTAPPYETDRIYARCGDAVKCIVRPRSVSSDVQIMDLSFTNTSDAAFQHGAIATLVQIPMEPKSHFGGHLIGVCGKLFLCGVVEPVPKLLPIRHPVAGTPTAMFYSETHDIFLVNTLVRHVEERTWKRFSLSTIFRLKQIGQSPVIKSEGGEGKQAAFRFPPGERLLCFGQVHLQSGDTRKHTLILTGSVLETEVQTDAGVQVELRGRLRWFRVRKTAEAVSLDCVKTSEESAPVQAVCTVDATVYYSAGASLKRRHWDPESSSWPKATMHRLPSPIISLHVHQNTIQATTSYHSTVALTLSQAAGQARIGSLTTHEPLKSLSHLPLPDVAGLSGLTTSASGLVCGIAATTAANGAERARSIFEAQVLSPVDHLLRANVRAPHQRITAPGVVHDDIFGISQDGTMFGFSLITDDSWGLLRFIYSICIRNPRISPLVSSAMRVRVPYEPTESKAQEHSVDGNMLRRLVDRADAGQLLQEVLDRELNPAARFLDGRRMDYDSARQRKERLAQLVASLTLSGYTSFDNVIRDALQYVRKVLERPL